ncbi:MAG: LysE family translocator, partial [Burkholderiaceae bacterium]
MLESLISIALAFWIVTVSPGPANIAVATVSMSAGRHAGMRFGFGLALGLAFWGLVAATGMGAVLKGSEIGLYAIKLIGGVYLLWLAFQSGRKAIDKEPDEIKLTGQSRWFLRGLALNLSNPKAVVAWMAALAVGLGTGNESQQVLIATLICMALGFINYAAHAYAFSLPGFMAGYQRFRQWIEGAVAGLFA